MLRMFKMFKMFEMFEMFEMFKMKMFKKMHAGQGRIDENTVSCSAIIASYSVGDGDVESRRGVDIDGRLAFYAGATFALRPSHSRLNARSEKDRTVYFTIGYCSIGCFNLCVNHFARPSAYNLHVRTPIYFRPYLFQSCLFRCILASLLEGPSIGP